MSGGGYSDWEEVFFEPELDAQTGNPLVQKNSPFMESMEPEFSHDFGYEDDAEDGTSKTYMYNIKTGSMIPSTYMLEILPEPKPQTTGCYDPK